MAEEIDLETCNFRTSEAQRPWPSPWIGSKSHWCAYPVPTHQIRSKSEKLFVDGQTEVYTDRHEFQY